MNKKEQIYLQTGEQLLYNYRTNLDLFTYYSSAFEELKIRIILEMKYEDGKEMRNTDINFLAYLEIKNRCQVPLSFSLSLVEQSKKGDATSTYLLGEFYSLGLFPFSNNPLKAFQLYKEASSKGCKYADYRLAECYFLGKGVTTNYHKAFEIFNKIKTLETNYYLGQIYLYGLDITQDIDRGKSLLESCIDNKEAKFILGKEYYLGKIFSKDNNKALLYLEEAKDDGCLSSYLYLGLIALDSEEYDKAYSYFLKAKEKEAQRYLGDIDIKNNDINSAMLHYEQAYKLGDKEAGKKYAILLNNSDSPFSKRYAINIMSTLVDYYPELNLILYKAYYPKKKRLAEKYLKAAINNKDKEAMKISLLSGTCIELTNNMIMQLSDKEKKEFKDLSDEEKEENRKIFLRIK